MKKYILIILILLSPLTAFLQADNLTSPLISIVPRPTQIVPGRGNFTFSAQTVFAVESQEQAVIARNFIDLFTRAAGITPALNVGREEGQVRFVTDSSLKSEAYLLEITPEQILIKASDTKGFFYALQSIRQLLPAAIESEQPVQNIAWNVPAMIVRDEPRFGFRGLLLDPVRCFIPKENVLRIIDCMAMLKINKLHFHLTDDNGWRVEIKKYPRLTEVGAWRVNRMDVPFYFRRNAEPGEPTPIGGFYTQEDIKEMVSYAADRQIEIIPEIDMPGHAEAALSAYPELGCFGLPVEIPQSGFTQNIFCAGKDGTLRFLKNVLDEVCALFPSPYIHLGGDEAPKGNWDQCPDCRKRITTEGLKDSHDLQLWFSAQMANYLKSKGRKAIFWGDVVYHDGYPLPDNTVIQWWNYRGHKDLALRNAVKHHYPVICSSNYYTYLNFPVTPWKGYTEARTFDLKDVYLNNPSDKAISEKNPLILGMSCALWTDDGVTERMIDRRLFPRILALSEQMWHEGEALDFDRFYRNILHRKAWFEEAGFEFGPALKEDVTKDYKWD